MNYNDLTVLPHRNNGEDWGHYSNSLKSRYVIYKILLIYIYIYVYKYTYIHIYIIDGISCTNGDIYYK